MGRKARMKSTFINKVNPGTMWKCHHDHNTIKFPVSVQKGDVVIILGIVELQYGSHSVVECFSQQKATTVAVTLEDFYFCYHKV